MHTTVHACSYLFDYRPLRATFATVLVLFLSLIAVLASCSSSTTTRSMSGHPELWLGSTLKVELGRAGAPWPVYLFSNIATNLPLDGLSRQPETQVAPPSMEDRSVPKKAVKEAKEETHIKKTISHDNDGLPVRDEGATYHLPQAVNDEGMADDQALAEAETLLLKSDILGAFCADQAMCGLVGEEELAQVLYSVGLSAKTKKPLHAVVHGPSSTGKTYTVKTVFSFIPDESQVVLTGLSEQALAYTGNLDRKVLFIEELPGTQKAEYLIRILQSERNVSRLVTVLGKKGFEAAKVSSEASAATVMTTTQDRIHPENETRVLRLVSDSSSEQTASVILETARRLTTSDSNPPDLDQIRRKWHALYGLIPDIPVVIPHQVLLAETFPAHEPRCRRAYEQFIGLVEVITLLHHRTRQTVQHQGEDHLVATTWDVQRAYRLAERFLFPERREPPAWHGVLPVLRAKGPLTRKQLEDGVGIKQTTAGRHLKEAVDAGCVERSSDSTPLYRWLREPEGTWELPSEAELDEFADSWWLAQAAQASLEGGGQASGLSEQGFTSTYPATRSTRKPRRKVLLPRTAEPSSTGTLIPVKRELPDPASPPKASRKVDAKRGKKAKAKAKTKSRVGKSKIEWTDETWNPVTGCTKVGKGCLNCYAEREAKRMRGRFGYPADDPFRVTLRPERLEKPLHWRKPRMVFLCSMGDLFHKDVPTGFIQQVFDVMSQRPQHTFQVLTKRPERAARLADHLPWPDHVWLGTSVEDDSVLGRIADLVAVPAAKHFVSIEPLLGPIQQLPLEGIDWVIVGGESGPGWRPMEEDWVREIRDQCDEANVKFFFKQRAGLHPKKLGCELDGQLWKEFPV